MPTATSPPRARHLLLLFFSLLLAISTSSSSTAGIVAATPVLSDDIDVGSVGNSNNNDNGENGNSDNSNGSIDQADADNSDNDDIENNTHNSNNSQSDRNPDAIPPVIFSLLPITNSESAPTDTDSQITQSSSELKLILHFTPMYPEASHSYPILRDVYKAYYSFDDGPMNAEWARFEGGPPGLGRTKCTIEGHDDFAVSNFMREGEVRTNIRGADYIWCKTIW